MKARVERKSCISGGGGRVGQVDQWRYKMEKSEEENPVLLGVISRRSRENSSRSESCQEY